MSNLGRRRRIFFLNPGEKKKKKGEDREEEFGNLEGNGGLPVPRKKGKGVSGQRENAGSTGA